MVSYGLSNRVQGVKTSVARYQLSVLARFFGLSLGDNLDSKQIPVMRDALSNVKTRQNDYPITASFVNGGFSLETIASCYREEYGARRSREEPSPQHS